MVWARSEDSDFHRSVARYIAQVLRGLGYSTRVRIASHGAITHALPKEKGGIQLIPETWFGGEVGPSDFLQTGFACDGTLAHGWFCDPQLDRSTDQASALEATDPKRAAAVWADVDRRVVDAAGWVPLLTPGEVEFVSSRVLQYHPIWGPLVDQFWLH
jgi:peptide/nickel transport system substrate-binding protein